jgi:hypothetical protein
MRMTSFLHRSKALSRKSSVGRDRRPAKSAARLRVESLEDRSLPSTVIINTNALTITGDPDGDPQKIYGVPSRHPSWTAWPNFGSLETSSSRRAMWSRESARIRRR